MKVHPIQFSFPDVKIPQLSVGKTTLFSDIVPDRAKKYKFFVEDDYYAHYSKSFFAVTMKKGGWDCLRHYEILASKTLPYFIGIEKCPADTLFAWPKELLLEIKSMPGLPSERKIISAMRAGDLGALKPGRNFDYDIYGQLHKQMMSVFHERLTGRSLARYFLKTINAPEKPKVLVCFGVAGSLLDYQRDTLISALGNDDCVELTTYPRPYWQEKGCHRMVLNAMYGRGFSCTATLSSDRLRSPADWGEIERRLDEYDVIVACSSSNHGFLVLPQEVQRALAGRTDVVWVDGGDIRADHGIPKCAKVVFKREMD